MQEKRRSCHRFQRDGLSTMILVVEGLTITMQLMEQLPGKDLLLSHLLSKRRKDLKKLKNLSKRKTSLQRQRRKKRLLRIIRRNTSSMSSIREHKMSQLKMEPLHMVAKRRRRRTFLKMMIK